MTLDVYAHLGSSPLTRGGLIFGGGQSPATGLIPAYAGRTLFELHP